MAQLNLGRILGSLVGSLPTAYAGFPFKVDSRARMFRSQFGENGNRVGTM